MDEFPDVEVASLVGVDDNRAADCSGLELVFCDVAIECPAMPATSTLEESVAVFIDPPRAIAPLVIPKCELLTGDAQIDRASGIEVVADVPLGIPTPATTTTARSESRMVTFAFKPSSTDHAKPAQQAVSRCRRAPRPMRRGRAPRGRTATRRCQARRSPARLDDDSEPPLDAPPKGGAR
jgi:hypothetical protein